MRDEVEELYDYDELRRRGAATMIVARVASPTLVLGGSQHREVLEPSAASRAVLRRRRGGGGVVLLRPDDLWVDWWIPADDPRWSPDVHESSLRVGARWATVLRELIHGHVTVHEGRLEGAPSHRVVCFAGRGPGEVFVDDRKAVGVTQWRVREGVFVSSVLPGATTADVLDFLAAVPPGLSDALEHVSRATLGLDDLDDLIARLAGSSEEWVRDTFLVAD